VSLRGSHRSLLVAELLGVGLLVVGLVLVVGYRSVYLNDASGPAVAFGLGVPATVVFGGVWMMGRTGPLVGRLPPPEGNETGVGDYVAQFDEWGDSGTIADEGYGATRAKILDGVSAERSSAPGQIEANPAVPPWAAAKVATRPTR
jgi:hypothetical protein